MFRERCLPPSWAPPGRFLLRVPAVREGRVAYPVPTEQLPPACSALLAAAAAPATVQNPGLARASPSLWQI